MGCLIWAVWIVAAPLAVLMFSLGGGWGNGFGVIVIVAAVGLTWLFRSADTPSTSPGAQPHDARNGAGAAEPTLADLLLEGRTIIRLGMRGRQGVAGEYYRPAAIERVVGGRPVAWAGDWDNGLRVPAYLVREPSNPHDRNAVAVYLQHEERAVHVGYLPREVAPRWQLVLRALDDAGRLASCPSQVYRDSRGDGYQVVLWVSPPDQAVIGNPEPAGAVFLDARRQCAISGENKHQDVLAVYQLGPVWATLHPATVESGKYAGQPTIEVRLDGRRVGAFTAAQGDRYAELLSAGEVVACEADVYEGSRSREIRVWVPRVDGIEEESQDPGVQP